MSCSFSVTGMLASALFDQCRCGVMIHHYRLHQNAEVAGTAAKQTRAFWLAGSIMQGKVYFPAVAGQI